MAGELVDAAALERFDLTMSKIKTCETYLWDGRMFATGVVSDVCGRCRGARLDHADQKKPRMTNRERSKLISRFAHAAAHQRFLAR